MEQSCHIFTTVTEKNEFEIAALNKNVSGAKRKNMGHSFKNVTIKSLAETEIEILSLNEIMFKSSP